MPTANPMTYDPALIDIDRLAELLTKLSPEQREALEIRLNPEAMKQLEDSANDIDSGKTVSLNDW